MKYGIWNVSEPKMDAVNALAMGGYSPLASMILAARGIADQEQAQAYLSCDAQLHDPFTLQDMSLAAGRLAMAMERGEKIAVFGDYDVDGITATCLLTDFLRRCGADCVPYIPGRLKEGYGLNPIAIRYLHEQGVRLIVSVDCGITAMEEAELCNRLGIDLVITDHHECKDQLPDAVAVVDPHRRDDTYPHKNLSGVGVAFKLAAALSGSQEQTLSEYADLVCLGTVADVMLLQGENRTFVDRGLAMLRTTRRPGIAALIAECGCDSETLTTSSIGFLLAPRINAAGRMGQIELAVELFLTQSAERATELARALCELNRQRQSVESEIYQQAISMLPEGRLPEAIVLADESWHQGVVGIVASRICEEFCCPTFLICLDGDHGKASSRSYGGFNLFTSLTALSDLLESYGGHELAAGFTIARDKIPEFRAQICRLAAMYYDGSTPRTTLDVDCSIEPEMLTLPGIESLSALEPCGNGCPKPVLMTPNLTIERISMVGTGRHMRLRLRRGRQYLNAIFFSATPEDLSIREGDVVDIAYVPQINEFRGERTVQLNALDIRPACRAECSAEIEGYRALRAGSITKQTADRLLPERTVLSVVWRYLEQKGGGSLQETPMCLCRKIVRWSNTPLSLEMMLVCLDIFAEIGLLELQRQHKNINIRLLPRKEQKSDVNASTTMQLLLRGKES